MNKRLRTFTLAVLGLAFSVIFGVFCFASLDYLSNYNTLVLFKDAFWQFVAAKGVSAATIIGGIFAIFGVIGSIIVIFYSISSYHPD